MFTVYNLKKEYTASGGTTKAKQCKDFMNITYGKTVTKEIEDSFWFITLKEFK